jgi:hypothetical protein
VTSAAVGWHLQHKLQGRSHKNGLLLQMRAITLRVNTRSGRKYADDPTVFAWELCNECQ